MAVTRPLLEEGGFILPSFFYAEYGRIYGKANQILQMRIGEFEYPILSMMLNAASDNDYDFDVEVPFELGQFKDQYQKLFAELAKCCIGNIYILSEEMIQQIRKGEDFLNELGGLGVSTDITSSAGVILFGSGESVMYHITSKNDRGEDTKPLLDVMSFNGKRLTHISKSLYDPPGAWVFFDNNIGYFDFYTVLEYRDKTENDEAGIREIIKYSIEEAEFVFPFTHWSSKIVALEAQLQEDLVSTTAITDMVKLVYLPE